MCATEEDLTNQRAHYGHTGSRELLSPAGKETLSANAFDKAVMSPLRDMSEKVGGFEWTL